MKSISTKHCPRLVSVLFLTAILTISLSCSSDSNDGEDYTCSTCSDTPDALAANDASARGVYKGVVIGSSGTIFLNIENGSNTVTATLEIDGETVVLTSTISVVNGEPYVAPFTGTLNGEPVMITFSVGLSGGNPVVTSSDIPGHPNAVFIVAKELSTSLIEAFEGTYSQPGESGTFNIILARGTINAWGGVSRENGSNEYDEEDGVIVGNDLYIDDVKIATISGDEMSGSFQNADNETVNVSGQRTL